MTQRKLTLEIIVDQDSKDWHWLYTSLVLPPAKGFINGCSITSLHEGWVAEDASDDEELEP